MQKTFLILIFHAFICTQAMAHQDTIIQVDKNGNMEGLPENYQPAKIDLENMAITIATTTFNMPPCVSKYFKNPKSYELQVSSSWYHDSSNLPPYINFKIIPKGKSWEYTLIFRLDDIKPIEFWVFTYPNERETYLHPIKIRDQCTKAIGSSYISK